MCKPLPSLNLETADATNSSVPHWVSVCQLNAKLLLRSPGSNIVVDGCFPGVWPSMHSQRPWQLPHARLSAALYRPLQVLNPPWCSFKQGGASAYPLLHTWECVQDHDVIYPNTKGLQLKEMNFFYVLISFTHNCYLKAKRGLNGKDYKNVGDGWNVKETVTFFPPSAQMFVFFIKKAFSWQRKQ